MVSFDGRNRQLRLPARAGVLAAILFSLSFIGDAAARSEMAVPEVTPGPTITGNYLAARHARIILREGEAAEFLLAALKKAPNDPDLLARALPSLLLAGRVQDGIRIAARAAAESELGPAELTLAVHDIKEKRFDAAIKRLSALPAAAHTDDLVSLLIAWSEFGRGHVDAALSKLQPGEGKHYLASLYNMHAAWMNAAAGRTEAAAKSLDLVLEEQKERWLRLVQLGGAVYERAGRRDDAIALYRAYNENHPESEFLSAALARATAGKTPPPPDIRTAAEGAAEALFDAAGVVSRQNSHETALIMGRLGLYLRPDFPALQVVVGDLLDGFERYEDADRVYAAVDRQSPLAWTANLSIARNLDRMDRFDEAKAMLEEMARQRPDDPEPYAELGDMYRKRERYAEAVAAYDKAFARISEVEPRHWRLLYVRGIALERTKAWPRAEADFLKALEFKPDQPAVLNYLGYSWVEMGIHLDKAEAMIRKAVDLQPNDGYIVDSLGWVLFKLGRAEEAVPYLERAVELRPEDPVINDHLGDIYHAVGRQREARYQWTAALDLDPDPELKKQLEAKLADGTTAQAESPAR